MFKRKGGGQRPFEHVKKNCTFLTGRLPLVLEEYLQMGRNILHVLIVNWHVDGGST